MIICKQLISTTQNTTFYYDGITLMKILYITFSQELCNFALGGIVHTTDWGLTKHGIHIDSPHSF